MQGTMEATMNLETDLTWRLAGRWKYVQPARAKAPVTISVYTAFLLGGVMPVLIGLMLALALIELKTRGIIP